MFNSMRMKVNLLYYKQRVKLCVGYRSLFMKCSVEKYHVGIFNTEQDPKDPAISPFSVKFHTHEHCQVHQTINTENTSHEITPQAVDNNYKLSMVFVINV